MSQISPFVKRMRAQGGTFYTFSSAVEDIGLNINERNNIVKMSNYALLDIPEITAPENLQQNRFNLLGIDGALQQFEEGGSTKDGGVLVAESFQNYALNVESNLLSRDDYNPALMKTVSERVFWKWMKETGAIRWTKDVSNAGYWIEEIDTDTSVGYNSVVKYVGEISAGSVRTDNFGTYNETYILVPTSHGQTRVYFNQVYDDNYFPGMEMGPRGDTILGRESYTKSHPDGLSYQGFYDVIDSATTTGDWDMFVDDGSGEQPGWWYTAQGKSFVDDNYYVTDVSTVLSDPSTYNYKLKYTNGGDEIAFYRSNVDALGIEFNINNLRDIFGDSTLTFDKMAIEDAVDDEFQFNAVLIYYTVYNKTLDKILATNLLGILFLDRASGNTVGGMPNMEIEIPEITKYQSNGTGFGSAYSFRVNIKSDNMMDDTGAVIYDESTSSQTALESWTDVFAGLQKSLNILNSNSQYLQYITDQYIDISSTQTQQGNLLADLQYQVNDVVSDVTGTNDTIAMFQDGDDPLVDSSIYMSDGRIGFFNPDPSYGFQVDTNISKFKEIIIENAIRDTSGNILIGYGSPLQIGSSTNNREINFYTGGSSPAISIDTFNNIVFDSSSITIPSDALQLSGVVMESSLGPNFIWSGGLLDVSVTGGGGGVSLLSQLSDVDVGGVTDGSVLKWDAGGGNWVPGTAGGGGGSGTVASVSAGDGMSFSTITTSGSVAVDNTVVRTSGDQTISGNKTFTGDIIGSNISEGAPDTFEYLFIDLSDGNKLKRTSILDASFLSYTDGVADNRIITSGGATSIQGQANLTFDGSILEFNNDTSKTIRMKADGDSSGLSMTIKGADAVGYSVSSGGTTTFLPFHTGGVVTPTGTGTFPALPTTKNYGTYNGYGVLTGVTTVTTLSNFIPGNTVQTVYGTTTYTGYDGGDLRIEAGSGGDGSTGGGLGIVNIGGDGGDLILNAGEGGSGYSSPGLKGDVLMSGNDFLLDGDGTAQINGSAIVLNSDIVDVGQQIRHRGDTNTYIEFTSDIIELTAGGVNMLRAAEGTEGGNFFYINPAGVDVDFYIKGNGGTEAYLVHADAGNSRVGINKSDPATTLDVDGSIKASGNVECATVTQAKTLSGTTTAASITPITAAEGEIWEIRGVETGGSLTGPGNYGSWTVLVFKESGAEHLLEAQIIDNGSSGSSVGRLSQSSTSIQIRIVPGTYSGSSSYRWTALRVN